MRNFILSGMQFGDEGKGSFVDYLIHEKNANCVVRYNGGSQASHTVVLEDGTFHKFSQLGSGMFLDTCHTYLTENMIVNLENLIVEMEAFCEETGVKFAELKKRVHIHENCYVVTPYHKLINKLRELSLGKNRRGSVGTGVSEVKYLLSEPSEIPLGVQVKDFYNPDKNELIVKLEAIRHYILEFYSKNYENIWKNTPQEMMAELRFEIMYWLCSGHGWPFSSEFMNLRNQRNDLSTCIYDCYELTLRKNHEIAVYEGSQGILLDNEFGIKPNTTCLDTTQNFALDMSYYRDSVRKIGIAKAFMSRHGFGVFPTETEEVSSVISDVFQEESFWNGKIRFGWFDTVLLKFAQRINPVDELYLSGLDELSRFEKVKVCTSYIYKGKVDKEFSEIFDYDIDYCGKNKKVIIREIRKNSPNLGKYLENCIPEYMIIDGWQGVDISNIKNVDDLPDNVIYYINIIVALVQVPVNVISVGRTRNHKIKIF